jgi:catechol 2,3-dioxygenase-like lactoylglutathione lyase family enzyme
MPAITERSTKKPLLETGCLSHGTLHCTDIAKTRRFYEEVLGLEVIQTSPISLMIRKGTGHVYAVVEQPVGLHPPMDFFNHNGLDVSSKAEVQQARALIMQVKEEWGIRKVLPVSMLHGEPNFFFMDFDGNWWEILALG